VLHRYIHGEIVKHTQREHAYQYIYRKLAEGSLPAGERLSPASLAREIGVSHIPVREAISQLHSEGLVVHMPHRGAFVKGTSRRDLVDLIEIRTLLEAYAAARAARRISPAQERELRDRWGDLCRAAETFEVPHGADLHEPMRQWLLADLAFHMVLLRAAGNRRVIRIIGDTRVMTQMFGYRTDSPLAWDDPVAFGRENLRVHRDIYEAVSRRDPKVARRAMTAHMKRAGRNMLARFDWLQRQSSFGSDSSGEFPDSMRDFVRDIQQHGLSDMAPRGLAALGKNRKTEETSFN
jgi:DNA-binding GntR family transcriptional regulator